MWASDTLAIIGDGGRFVSTKQAVDTNVSGRRRNRNDPPPRAALRRPRAERPDDLIDRYFRGIQKPMNG